MNRNGDRERGCCVKTMKKDRKVWKNRKKRQNVVEKGGVEEG